MKTTTMLTPDEGMILFNGSEYSEMVFPSTLEAADTWREVPRSEYDAWLAEQQAEIDALDKPEELKAELAENAPVKIDAPYKIRK